MRRCTTARRLLWEGSRVVEAPRAVVRGEWVMPIPVGQPAVIFRRTETARVGEHVACKRVEVSIGPLAAQPAFQYHSEDVDQELLQDVDASMKYLEFATEQDCEDLAEEVDWQNKSCSK